MEKPVTVDAPDAAKMFELAKESVRRTRRWASG